MSAYPYDRTDVRKLQPHDLRIHGDHAQTWRTLRGMYIGIGIFAVLAVLCVVAFFVSRKRRRDYEWDE